MTRHLLIALLLAAAPLTVAAARDMGPALRAQTLVYGTGPQRAVDYHAPPAGVEAPPLLVYVHGGGWRNGDKAMVAAKPDWARAQGLAFASVGYGLLPDTPVEGQAADIAAAIRHLSSQAAALNFDPDRIILMGHSAGAHLVALIATDPAWLGSDLAAIKGVIPLDGAAYDVPRQIEAAPFMARRIYGPAFGTDAARQQALSPVHHAARPNAPRWLIVHSSQRDDAASQARLLAVALRKAGADVGVKPVPLGHRAINVDLGRAGYPAQAEIDALVAAVRAAR